MNMKMTLAERLKEARKSKGLTQKALGEIVGVSQAAIQKVETGKANQTTKIIDIAQALGVRPEWLASGEEPMRADQKPTPSPNYSTIVPTRLKAVVWEDLTESERNEFIEIPLLNVSLSAGNGDYVVDEESEFSLTFRRYYLWRTGVPESAARLVRISGNSMEPTLHDGDVVGVNLEDTVIRDGKTYAIRQGDLLRVKMLVATPSSIIIRSINKEEYPDEVMSKEEFHRDVHVIGRVFWSSHTW